ncbi:hypothetical protein, partial [Paraburkholderia hospita]|uniref:hypothetical protein n=1 Tax=Paraburkholderia hospita TaxID=169430 RepID=UPI001EE641D1
KRTFQNGFDTTDNTTVKPRRGCPDERGRLNFAPAKGVVPRARGCIIWWCCEYQRRHRWSLDAANDLQQDRLL